MSKKIAFLLATAFLVAPNANAATVRTLEEALTLESGEILDLDFPIGDLKLRGTHDTKADLVVGIRLPHGRGVPASHRVSRWLAPLVLGKAFRGAPVRDPLSGFRAYRVIVLKKALRALDEDRNLVAADGWGANLELLSRAAPHARRIAEAPIAANFLRRERASRFRALPSLRGLVGLRRIVWPSS